MRSTESCISYILCKKLYDVLVLTGDFENDLLMLIEMTSYLIKRDYSILILILELCSKLPRWHLIKQVLEKCQQRDIELEGRPCDSTRLVPT